MFQCIKYEDKREVFGLKIHSFSTLDRIKKYNDSDNEENAEKPYSIEVGEIERTINLYAIASTKFQVAVQFNISPVCFNCGQAIHLINSELPTRK